MTYQSLHRLSSINRNLLRRRLEELVMYGALIKCKFGLPYNREFYGYLYRLRKGDLYTEPPNARTYYILNLLSDAVKGFLNIYHEKVKIRYKSSPPIREVDVTSQLRNRWDSNSLDKLIFLEHKIREDEWSDLPKIFDYRRDQIRDTKDHLVKFVDFIIEKKYSIFDLIIRCANLPTAFIEEGTYLAPKLTFFLPIYRYRDIVEMLFETKFNSSLTRAFAISST